jgi:hypothetical protein
VVTDVFGIRASDIVLKTSAGLWAETIEHGLTQVILWFRFTFGGQKNEELFGRPNVPLVRRSFGKSRSKSSAAQQCAMRKQLNYQSDGTSGREPVDALAAVMALCRGSLARRHARCIVAELATFLSAGRTN